MAPVRSYYNWNQRKSDTNEAIEPYRKYFFICEGANTETWYFEKLVDYKKELGINPAGSAKQKSQQTSLIQYLSAYLLVFEKHFFALKLDFLL